MASKRNRRKTITTTIILALALVILIYFLSRVWAFTVDDTYITLRYARNVVGGEGLTFNPGESPVEGYTTFLWMLFLTLPHLLGLPPVLFSKVVGLLCTLGTLIIVYRLVNYVPSLGRGAFFGMGGALAVLFLCANPATAVHAVSGMETALFNLLLAACVLYAARWHTGRATGDGIILSLLTLLLGLTRPEGNLIGVVVLGSLLWASSPADRKRLFVTIAGWYVLPGVIYFAWRTWYFGLLFPLPFYVKVSAASYFNGLIATWRYVRDALLPLSIPLLIGLWRNPGGMLPGVLGSLALILFFIFPRHMMGYEWRYVFPASVVASALAGIGILRLLEGGDTKNRGRLVLAGMLVLVAVGGLLLTSPQIIHEKQEYARGIVGAHELIGKRLAVTREQVSNRTLATGDVGAVAYYSDWKVIDLQGLNDPHLARAAGFDPDYVMAQHPEVIILISMDSTKFLPRFRADESLFETAAKQGFERVSSARFADKYYLWVTTSRNSPLKEMLRFP